MLYKLCFYLFEFIKNNNDYMLFDEDDYDDYDEVCL